MLLLLIDPLSFFALGAAILISSVFTGNKDENKDGNNEENDNDQGNTWDKDTWDMCDKMP